MTQFVIEIYDGRNSKKCTRHSFSHKNKVTLGRAYASTVVIEDAHVCAEHVTISYKKEILIEDMDSINGIRIKKKTYRGETIPIDSGTEVFIGQTKVKIYTDNHEIQPTKAINWAHYVRDYLANPFIALSILAITLLLETLSTWTFYIEPNFFDRSIYDGLYVTGLALTLLSCMIIVAGYMSKHRTKILSSISYASIMMLVFTFLVHINHGFAGYTNPYATMAMTLGLKAVILSGIFTLLVYIEFNKLSIKEIISAALILFGVPIVGSYEHIFPDEYARLTPFHETSLPLNDWEPSKAMQIDEFIEETDDIFVKTSALKEI